MGALHDAQHKKWQEERGQFEKTLLRLESKGPLRELLGDHYDEVMSLQKLKRHELSEDIKKVANPTAMENAQRDIQIAIEQPAVLDRGISSSSNARTPKRKLGALASGTEDRLEAKRLAQKQPTLQTMFPNKAMKLAQAKLATASRLVLPG